ncbi:hypothetical protein UABAM_04810 [Candidatus Uabimicrobium amorphum]|uniref:Uncharacterized protein n=1 Tax=Uabimicrobium amorphum TaxID=2596890 RepID=A0A5S9IR87_UABAM|nr:hypothetical protein UABAM_04810 [Candidatus Uabimicrobium amorphum]
MLSSEYIYPLWFVIRILLFLFTSLVRKYDVLLAILFAITPCSCALGFLGGFEYVLLCEFAVFITFFQIRFHRDSHVFSTIIFTLHFAGPFCKFIFSTLYNIDFPIMHLPSALNFVINPHDISYGSFLFLLYPMPFFWSQNR